MDPEALRQAIESAGFAVEVRELPGTRGKKANLVATLGRGPGGLVLAGHTDKLGAPRFDNMRLSKERSEAGQSLLALAGVDPARIRTQGFGATRPLVDASVSRANRAVEVFLLPQGLASGQGGPSVRPP